MTSFVFSLDYDFLTSHTDIQPFSNFAIKNCGKTYFCNDLVASSLSKTIAQAKMENIAATEIEIDAGEGPMEIVIDFLNGRDVEIPEEAQLFVLKAAIDLGMDLLVDSINIDNLQIPPRQALELAVKGYEKGVPIDKFSSKIAPGFGDLIKEGAFDDVPDVVIDIILSSKLVKVPTNVFIPFLLKYFNFAKNPNHRLAKYYPFTEIPEKVATSLLMKQNVNINQFLSLMPIYSKNVSNEPEDIKNTIEYNDNDPLNGIMYALCHPTITSSSIEKGSIDNLIIEEGAFLSKEEENPSLIFDFGLNCICITSYTLCTRSQLESGVAPASWKIEVSSHKDVWELVDERTADLTISPGIFNFKTKMNSFYKYVRFTQLKSSNPENDKRLSLSRIEFFGKLRN